MRIVVTLLCEGAVWRISQYGALIVSHFSPNFSFKRLARTSLPTQRGFWGTRASGKTIADLNDRTGESTRENAETLYMVEDVVGTMSSVVEMPVDQAFAKLRWFSESQGAEALPAWCTERFVAEVSERMRRLLGQWKATHYGGSMELVCAETDT